MIYFTYSTYTCAGEVGEVGVNLKHTHTPLHIVRPFSIHLQAYAFFLTTSFSNYSPWKAHYRKDKHLRILIHILAFSTKLQLLNTPRSSQIVQMSVVQIYYVDLLYELCKVERHTDNPKIALILHEDRKKIMNSNSAKLLTSNHKRII